MAARPLDRNVMRLAALFVQPSGCYADLPGIDAWPEQRDARRYAGPLPVVAHPPCQLWGAMANVNYARWGGEHNKPGNDGGCFAAALDSVRRFGGVLEHPAKTKAWAAHGLAQPAGIGWQRTVDGGWVCEVWQSAYGHRANKATWLYYHGTNPPFELRWDRPAGTPASSFERIPVAYDHRMQYASPMRMHNSYGSPLKQWLERPESPALTKFAETLGVSRVYLSQIVASDPSKRRAPSAALCVDIERATAGAVTRADLRPDDYWLIWPDLPQPAKAANDQEARDAA